MNSIDNRSDFLNPSTFQSSGLSLPSVPTSSSEPFPSIRTGSSIRLVPPLVAKTPHNLLDAYEEMSDTLLASTCFQNNINCCMPTFFARSTSFISTSPAGSLTIS
ncbi:hypothetical protein Plhal304r1_c039g0116291 [Plasmopara halstedii]